MFWTRETELLFCSLAQFFSTETSIAFRFIGLKSKQVHFSFLRDSDRRVFFDVPSFWKPCFSYFYYTFSIKLFSNSQWTLWFFYWLFLFFVDSTCWGQSRSPALFEWPRKETIPTWSSIRYVNRFQIRELRKQLWWWSSFWDILKFKLRRVLLFLLDIYLVELSTVALSWIFSCTLGTLRDV